jgi:23S rRNA pseudouridine1911/1915/1917 synthase
VPEGRSIRIKEEANGERLDRALALAVPELSRTKIQRLINDGGVRVDGVVAAKVSQPVETGQTVTLQVPEEAPPPLPRAEAIPLEILYEDERMVAIDKPAGLVVHPGAGHLDGTLVSALLHRYGKSLSDLGGPERPGLVHRLDKGTSGVLVVARDNDAHQALSRQFAERTVEKEYDAFVYGTPRDKAGVIDRAIGRDRNDRTKISTDTDRPREALSRWQRHEDFPGFSWLRVRTHTGRMHQVRAHLTAIHHPCIGDAKYAGMQWKGVPDRQVRDAVRKFPRAGLHARRLCIDHPGSGERLELTAPLPADLQELLEMLRNLRDRS